MLLIEFIDVSLEGLHKAMSYNLILTLQLIMFKCTNNVHVDVRC